MGQLKEIEELAQPLLEYLKKEFGPYTEIVISNDSITVKESVIGIPLKNGD